MNRQTFLSDASTILVAFTLFAFTYILGPIIGNDLARVIAFAPLLGTLLRFRINYEPRPRNTQSIPNLGDIENAAKPSDVCLGKSNNRGGVDSEVVEGGVEPVRGYLHIMKKTMQTEGLRGIYKGITPPLIVWFLTVFLCAVVPYMPYRQCRAWGDEGYWVSQISGLFPLSGEYYVIRALIALLLRVSFGGTVTLFVNRAISTRHSLSFFSRPGHALHSLFTTKERSDAIAFFDSVRPFYRAVFVREAFILLIQRPSSKALTNLEDTPQTQFSWRIALIVLAIYSGTIVCALLLTPLEVAAARLSVVYPAEEEDEDEGAKGDQATSGSSSVGFERQDAVLPKNGIQDHSTPPPQAAVLVTPPPRSFRLRHEPYKNLTSCIRDIAAEEGYTILLRGWYVTLIRLMFA